MATAPWRCGSALLPGELREDPAGRLPEDIARAKLAALEAARDLGQIPLRHAVLQLAYEPTDLGVALAQIA